MRPSSEWGPAWEVPELRGMLTKLPDYMISEKEEGIPNLVLVKERSLNFSQDDMDDSVSTMDVSVNFTLTQLIQKKILLSLVKFQKTCALKRIVYPLISYPFRGR